MLNNIFLNRGNPNRLEVVFLFLSLVALTPFCCSAYAVALQPPKSTEKTITIVTGERDQPAWKIAWDQARSYVQQGRNAEAIDQYLLVLKDKPLIEEVKWELCKILIEIGDYQKASFYLESLLEVDPGQTDYLISAGDLALKAGNTEQAIRYYGQVLEEGPLSAQADKALAGFVEALLQQGKDGLAIPLMEQLLVRGNNEQELLLSLAEATEKAGLSTKARHYYLELVKKFRVSAQVILQAARFFELQKQYDDAAELWERYLADNPTEHQYRIKLVDYYLGRQEPLKALPHLNYLVENNIGKDRYLINLARINLYNAGRSDRALAYFEQYQRDFPTGVDVSSEIADIQVIMANDLVTIVENNGAWRLWRDLARITPDRIGIYRAMADVLEQLGKTNELLDVLQIIVQHDPADTDARTHLARMLLANKQYNRCREVINESKAVDQIAALLILRAECEAELGYDVEQLQSYIAYLRVQKNDRTVRSEAIKLAGKLGLINRLDELVEPVELSDSQERPILLAYVTALYDCQQFDRAITALAAHAPTTDKADPEIEIWKAKNLLAKGLVFEGEKVLRTLLAKNVAVIESLLYLIDSAIDRFDYQAAQAWLGEAEKVVDEDKLHVIAEDKRRLRSRAIMLDWFTDNQERALLHATEYLLQLLDSEQITAADNEMLLFINNNISRPVALGELANPLRQLIQQYPSNTVLRMMARSYFKSVVTSGVQHRLPGRNQTMKAASTVSVIDEANVYLKGKNVQLGLSRLKSIDGRLVSSARVDVLEAQLFLASHAYQKAYRKYSELSLRFPQEQFYREQLEKISQQADVGTLSPENRSVNGTGGKTAQLSQSDQRVPLFLLNKARASWATNNWEQALNQYQELFEDLSIKVDTLFQGVRETSVFHKQFPQWFHNSLISPDEEEILDQIMDPDFFVRYRKSDLGMIAASYYDVYRWWKIVKKEREAKIALNQREFYQAEQKYHELYDIDAAAAEMSVTDLATIYSRLGKRQQESALFERIKDTNRNIPELREASEKNIRQRQPHVSLDTDYHESRGRNGQIDISRLYAGANIQFTPAVYHEAGAWFGRNEYGNSIATTLGKSVFLGGKYSIFFNDFLEGEVKLGFEDFDTDGKSFLIYDASLFGTLEEKVNVSISFNQHPVTDTFEAVAEGIYRKEFRFGTTLDFLPRVFLGFDFRLNDFSDLNDGREFNIFASYRVFREQSSLDFTYRYQKIENSITNELLAGEEGETMLLLPYWSPGKYWKHMITAEYRLELWPTGKLQGGTSYVSASYGVGFETGDTLVQRAECNISLEINPVFLIKGRLSSDWSNDYDEYGASASLAYRW